VTIASASVLCNKRLDPIDADHSSIVKPVSPTDVPFLAFKTAYLEEINISRGLPSEAAQMQFDELLTDLNRTLLWNRDELFPLIDAYIAYPSEERWRKVRSSAAGLLEQIRGAVSRAMQFDSKFFEQGNKVLLIAGDARRETVDRSYYQPFQEARDAWSSRALVVERVTEYLDMPTREQAEDWRDNLARHYDRLQVELQRLLLLGQAPI
jgi:hypothetical protein